MTSLLELLFQFLGLTYEAAMLVAVIYWDLLKRSTMRLGIGLLVTSALGGIGLLFQISWLISFAIVLTFFAIGLWSLVNILGLIVLQLAYTHFSPLRQIVLVLGTLAFYSIAAAAYVYYTDAAKTPGLLILLVLCGGVIVSHELRYGATVIPGFTSRRAHLWAIGAFVALALPIGVRTYLKNKADDLVNPYPQRVVYSGGDLQCYDTKRRTPQCWCHVSPEGAVEIFNRAGYHPEGGQEFSQCTLDQIKIFKQQQAKLLTPSPAIFTPAPPILTPVPKQVGVTTPSPLPVIAVEAPVRSTEPPPQPPAYYPPPTTVPVQYIEPDSREVSVYLSRAINTTMAMSGHHFRAELSQPCTIKGTTYPIGTQVKGQITELKQPSIGRNASMKLHIVQVANTRVVTDEVPISMGSPLENRKYGLGSRRSGSSFTVTQGHPLTFTLISSLAH